ncbi:alpha/beta hydrolase [Pseudomonas sp. JDS28PS106]|uniref:alpha/beta hydrolase n=1 Tax=Pseudomonas sp. JDS28PS106 TaxID=2497235 RepID=UPI002FD2AD2B
MTPDELLDPQYALFRDEASSEWTLDNLPAIRARIAATYARPGEGRGEQRWIPGAPGASELRVCLYRPAAVDLGAALPAILYVHGGGFVLGAPEMMDDYLVELAVSVGALVIAVDYRLAPEHPFPAPVEDCFAALRWMFHEAEALGLDRRRIVLMGHSAGGGLAAGLAIMARDCQLPPLAGLALVYPMLDHRTGTPGAPSHNPVTGTFSWSREANRFCWECLRGGFEPVGERAAWLSPALAPTLEGLPTSFVGTGGLDLFMEEDVAFALQLSRSGVPVELHVYPGMPHMFDLHPGRVTEQCRADVLRALLGMCGR